MKKKKKYVKPEMKIVNVKTEGVIAASGGDIEIPETDFINGCQNNYFSNSCGAPEPKISQCNDFRTAIEGTIYNSCFKETSPLINPYNWYHVTLTKKEGKVIISKGWTTEK